LDFCAPAFRTPREIADHLHRDVVTVRKNYLPELVHDGRLVSLHPNTPSHPLQAYKTRTES
jgi:hypothetical protein